MYGPVVVVNRVDQQFKKAAARGQAQLRQITAVLEVGSMIVKRRQFIG